MSEIGDSGSGEIAEVSGEQDAAAESTTVTGSGSGAEASGGEAGEVGAPKTGPEIKITGQNVPASEVSEDKGRGGENGGDGRGDDSLTSKFNAAAGERPAPSAATGTVGGDRTAKGPGSDQGGGPGISPTMTPGTDKPLDEDEPLPNYPGVEVSEESDAKGRNVNRPKGPKL
jgi:hypothetical protein